MSRLTEIMDGYYESDNDVSEAIAENISKDVIKLIREAREASSTAQMAIFMKIGQYIFDDSQAYLEEISRADMEGEDGQGMTYEEIQCDKADRAYNAKIEG